MTDEYDLPQALFGQLPDWIFPAIGRVVAVSSLVEYRSQVLAESLAYVQQDTLTTMSTADRRRVACRAAKEIDGFNAHRADTSLSHQVAEFFDRVQRVLERRNSVVHAIWPAQAGEEQFGWRPGRGTLDEPTRVTEDNTLGAMKDLIRCGSAIVRDWETLYSSANHARMLALGAGYQGLEQDKLIANLLARQRVHPKDC